jgi:hypothetical protein
MYGLIPSCVWIDYTGDGITCLNVGFAYNNASTICENADRIEESAVFR